MAAFHHATERWSLPQAAAHLAETQAHLDKVLARLQRLRPIGPGSTVLDVGAAQGLVLICAARRGLRAVGVEPWEAARDVAQQLARQEGVAVEILPGQAERLPVEDGRFDLVHAQSVFEHVVDLAAALGEACRVLVPGGVLWFSAASSVCPRQKEISGFPCFGWYPDRLKRRIMRWAKARRPGRIGHTETPAIHWLTPAKARRLLRQAGFREVYDRWDLRLPSEGGRVHAAMLRIVRSSRITKLLADVCVPACSYAAVK